MKNPVPKKTHSQFNPFIYPIKEKRTLDFVPPDYEADFLTVLQNRESAKPTIKPNKNSFSFLINFCSKIREVSIDSNGFITSKRIVPSAGGRHPIDLLIVCADQKDKIQYYNPIDNTLSSLNLSSEKVSKFLREVEKNIKLKNANLVWFSIQHLKTGSKYENPESLYWKDTGAMLYCLQIMSTYLGFKSCPIGTLATKQFYNLFETNNLISGGGIIIGT